MTETAESSLNHDFYAPSESSSLHEDIDFDTMNMITTTEIQKDPQSQVDGIEILVNMAKTGKIDPWNVDIVDITDKYLAHLFPDESPESQAHGQDTSFCCHPLAFKIQCSGRYRCKPDRRYR